LGLKPAGFAALYEFDAGAMMEGEALAAPAALTAMVLNRLLMAGRDKEGA
jgi:hypothetical protein